MTAASDKLLPHHHASITLAQYGQITAVRDPRTIQPGMKFLFLNRLASVYL